MTGSRSWEVASLCAVSYINDLISRMIQTRLVSFTGLAASVRSGLDLALLSLYEEYNI